MPFSLFPREQVPSILDLSPAWLSARGVDLLLLDFDNTVVPYTVSAPTPEFLSWLEAVRSAGVRVMVVSNSRRSHRVPEFCKKFDIPYIKRAGKPFPRGIRRAMARFRAAPSRTALAGDQIFTDVLGANLAGVLSIAVQPLHFSNPFQALRYGIERPIRRLAERTRKR